MQRMNASRLAAGLGWDLSGLVRAAVASALWGLWAAEIWHGRSGLPPAFAFLATAFIWGLPALAAFTLARKLPVPAAAFRPVRNAAVLALGTSAFALLVAVYASDRFNHTVTPGLSGPDSSRPLVLAVPVLAAVALGVSRALPRFLRSIEARVVLGLAIAAFALSAWSANWALPAAYHPDETIWVWRAVHTVAAADANPDYFFNPSLYAYTLAAMFGSFYLAGRWLGTVPGPEELEILFAHRPEWFFTAARLENALWAAALTPLVYVIATRLGGRKLGLGAAALMTPMFLVTRAAHHATTDLLATFLAICLLAATLAAWQRPTWGRIVVAAALLGLATGSKYNGLLGAGPLAAVLVLRWVDLRGSNARKLVGAAALPLLAGAAFLATTPYAVLDWQSFRLHLTLQAQESGLGIAWGQAPDPTIWLAAQSLVQGAGILAVALAVLGILRTTRRPGGWILLLNGLITIAVVTAVVQFRARFLLTLVPLVAIWAADGAIWLGGLVVHGRRWLTPALVTLLIVQPVLYSVRHNLLLGRVDTREQARIWVRANLPLGAGIGVEAHTILDTRINAWEFSAWGPSTPRQYTVFMNDWKDAQPAEIKARGLGYAVVSSYVYDRYVRSGFRPAPPPFYGQLDAEATLLARFGPGRGGSDVAFDHEEVYTPFWRLFERERPGPTVKVYELP